MPLNDLLKTKDKLSNDEGQTAVASQTTGTPEFKFLRTDTYSQEVIEPPSFADDREGVPVRSHPSTPADAPQTASKLSLGRLRKSSNASPSPDNPKEHRRLSQRLHLSSRSRASSTSSSHIPADLPTIADPYSETGDKQEKEAKWEERATMLARENVHSRPPTAEMSQISIGPADAGSQQRSHSRSRSTRSISDVESDENIQEAIRLHEAGELTKATEMFGRLAETGNVLSQVLYGLSLRHGWGCTADPARAVTYLSAAAANSASIESEALASGMKKGGAAKGELVLAIFELANCFRNGWGVEVDKAAARQYYETAANLGDTDAMNEAAWCYLEGFGGKKDKVSLSACRLFLHCYKCGPIDREYGATQLAKHGSPTKATAIAGRNHVQPHRRFQPHPSDIGKVDTITVYHITEGKQPSQRRGGDAQPKAVRDIGRIWPFQIPNWPCYYYGPDPILIPRASLWAAMHILAASHVVTSLALATCTISTNDRADSGILQFKAAQLLRLAENSGSKILGNTWIWKDKYNPK